METETGKQEDAAMIDHWRKELLDGGATEDEIEKKVGYLVEFCDFANETPSGLVRSVLKDGKVIISKRKALEETIERFAGDSVEKANAIRSFMIHNGVRMIAPRPPWL